MQGNKIFPNDILEIKYDHQGFTVVIGCEFCTLWAKEGLHIYYKRGKYSPLDYIQSVCTQKCCHYILLPVATCFSLSAT